MRTEEGKLYLLVAIDRTTKLAFVELHEKATCRVAGDCLRALAAAVPYKIHAVLTDNGPTDNGTHFADPSGETWTPAEIKPMRADKVLLRCHSFEGACADLVYRAPPHRASSSLDEWSERAHEPDDQGRHHTSAFTTTITTRSGSTSPTSSRPAISPAA